jgi:hypothetical protein
MKRDKLSKLNVNRGEMATALDRGFAKFAKATEDEIDARIKEAFRAHNQAHHGTWRQRIARWLERVRG